MSQFIQQVTVPGSGPYTVTLDNPTDAALVDVQAASGASVAGCTIAGSVVTFPSGEAGSVLWVVYTATPSSDYSGSEAQAGRGTQLLIGASPVLIGEVDDLPLNRGKWEVVDTTNFQSGADSEQLVTIRKPGTITFKFNRVSANAGQAAVESAYQSGALTAFTLQLPINAAAGQASVGDKYTFNAFVISSDFTDQVAQVIKGSVDLNISGGCTLAVGS